MKANKSKERSLPSTDLFGTIRLDFEILVHLITFQRTLLATISTILLRGLPLLLSSGASQAIGVCCLLVIMLPSFVALFSKRHLNSGVLYKHSMLFHVVMFFYTIVFDFFMFHRLLSFCSELFFYSLIQDKLLFWKLNLFLIFLMTPFVNVAFYIDSAFWKTTYQNELCGKKPLKNPILDFKGSLRESQRGLRLGSQFKNIFAKELGPVGKGSSSSRK